MYQPFLWCKICVFQKHIPKASSFSKLQLWCPWKRPRVRSQFNLRIGGSPFSWRILGGKLHCSTESWVKVAWFCKNKLLKRGFVYQKSVGWKIESVKLSCRSMHQIQLKAQKESKKGFGNTHSSKLIAPILKLPVRVNTSHAISWLRVGFPMRC